MQQMLPPRSLWWGHPTNSEGHYDEDFGPRAPGQTVVATIGDSFSVGSVHHSLHFTTVAERSSGLRIDNYGAVSIGPREYLDILRLWVAPREPDLVVINLFIGNDLFTGRYSERAWIRSGRWLGPWLDRENALLWQVPRRTLLARAARPLLDYDKQPQVRLETRAELLEALPWMEDPALEPASFDRETFLGMERFRARDIGIAGDCAAVNELLAQMRTACGQAPLAVMLIPDELQVEDALWNELRARWPDLEPAERDRPQRLIGAFLAAEDIPYLDLLPVLRAQPPLEDGDRHLYHLQDTHFNARGNQVAGEALARFLRDELGR